MSDEKVNDIDKTKSNNENVKDIEIDKTDTISDLDSDVTNANLGQISEEKKKEEIKIDDAEIKKQKQHLVMKGLLVDPDIYLENGVMLGLKYKTSDMRPYIYTIKTMRTEKMLSKICIFDIAKIDNRIRTAAKFLSVYDPKDVLIVSNRLYGKKPASVFARYCGFTFVEERFASGALTNPNIRQYKEPEIIFITDPIADKQVIEEASQMNIPIIAICNSNTRFKNIDFVIPGNNRSKNSLALIFWLLTKEMSKIKNFEFNTPCPRAVNVDAEGNEVSQTNEFLSLAEPQEYLVKMQQINKLLFIKRKLKRRGKKKNKREKKLVRL